MKPGTLNAWAPMIGLASAAAVLAILALLFDGVAAMLDHFLWQPIVLDLGYNPVNTTVLVVLAFVGLVWLYRLFQHYGEPVDLATGIGGLLFFSWGVMLRLFEDSDLFAPFADRAGSAACVPDPTGLADCAGILFITPLLWIWLALLLFAFGRIGLQVQWIEAKHGRRAGRIAASAWLAAAALVHLFWWLRPPAWVAAVPHPLPVAIVAGIVGWVIWRKEAARWSDMLIGLPIVMLAGAADLVLTWFRGGVGAWTPTRTMPSFLWIAVALAVVVAMRTVNARAMAGPRVEPSSPEPARRAKRAKPAVDAGPKSGGNEPLFSRSAAMLLYLDLVTVIIVFIAATSLASDGNRWWVLLVLPIVHLAARHPRHRDARLAEFATPIALLMLLGQAADAIVTSIGLDVLGAGEKHFVPRALIAGIEAMSLPDPFGSYPTAIVLIGYKIPLVAFATWILRVRARAWDPSLRDAAMLASLTVAFIGFAPALRNALRIAMGI